jgi:hypothetical protein
LHLQNFGTQNSGNKVIPRKNKSQQNYISVQTRFDWVCTWEIMNKCNIPHAPKCVDIQHINALWDSFLDFDPKCVYPKVRCYRIKPSLQHFQFCWVGLSLGTLMSVFYIALRLIVTSRKIYFLDYFCHYKRGCR